MEGATLWDELPTELVQRILDHLGGWVLLLAPVCCGLSSYLGMERTQAANHNDLALWSLQHPGRGAGCPWYCGFGCGLPIGAVFRWWTYLDGSIPLTVNVEYGLFARSNGRTPYLRREAWFGKYFGFTGKLTLADGDRMDAMLEGAMLTGFARKLVSGCHGTSSSFIGTCTYLI